MPNSWSYIKKKKTKEIHFSAASNIVHLRHSCLTSSLKICPCKLKLHKDLGKIFSTY